MTLKEPDGKECRQEMLEVESFPLVSGQGRSQLETRSEHLAALGDDWFCASDIGTVS